jgi:hypothetical protein
MGFAPNVFKTMGQDLRWIPLENKIISCGLADGRWWRRRAENKEEIVFLMLHT